MARHIYIDGPRRTASLLWCLEPACEWEPDGATTEAARDHVLDTGHIVKHDIVLSTTFRVAGP